MPSVPLELDRAPCLDPGALKSAGPLQTYRLQEAWASGVEKNSWLSRGIGAGGKVAAQPRGTRYVPEALAADRARALACLSPVRGVDLRTQAQRSRTALPVPSALPAPTKH